MLKQIYAYQVTIHKEYVPEITFEYDTHPSYCSSFRGLQGLAEYVESHVKSAFGQDCREIAINDFSLKFPLPFKTKPLNKKQRTELAKCLPNLNINWLSQPIVKPKK